LRSGGGVSAGCGALYSRDAFRLGLVVDRRDYIVWGSVVFRVTEPRADSRDSVQVQVLDS